MEHSKAMARLRPVLFALAVLFLTACDGYVEQVTLDGAGGAEFRAEATVVCADPLQREVWGGDGCDQIDALVRGAEADDLPFDFVVDTNRVGLVADGDLDRRRIDATWDGTMAELETVLAHDGQLRVLDETRTEATFSSVGSAADRFAQEYEVDANWEIAQFRVIAPDLVVEHNGDTIQGRTVVWRIDGTQPDTFRVVWTSEERGFQVWWWFVAGAILIGVLIMMVVLEGPNRAGSRAGSASGNPSTGGNDQIVE